MHQATAMPHIDRRRFLQSAAALPALALLPAPRPAPARAPAPRADDERLIVVDGWVLKRSDLALLERR